MEPEFQMSQLWLADRWQESSGVLLGPKYSMKPHWVPYNLFNHHLVPGMLGTGNLKGRLFERKAGFWKKNWRCSWPVEPVEVIFSMVWGSQMGSVRRSFRGREFSKKSEHTTQIIWLWIKTNWVPCFGMITFQLSFQPVLEMFNRVPRTGFNLFLKCAEDWERFKRWVLSSGD